MSTPVAVIGAGLIGHRHAEALKAAEGVTLAAIADPSPAGAEVAARHGVPAFDSLEAVIESGLARGVILALPNALHLPAGLTAIAAGLPVLMEKPLATTVDEGEALVRAADAADVPLLTGHHRRHNPRISKALEVVRSGALGQLTAVQAQTWFLKPERYFEQDWRTRAGAGPVYLNLIHDIDLLLAFCGPVAEVQAMESRKTRGFEVEDTAVALLRFVSGVLGTVNVSDAAAAPWSWELTAHENAHYAATDENCYWFAGTQGSLALPNLALWEHEGPDGWWSPIHQSRPETEEGDPLIRQAAHFGAVIRGEAEPVVSGQDGLNALRVIEAIKRAAATGAPVRPDAL